MCHDFLIGRLLYLNLLPARIAAYSDGHVNIFELLDPLELEKWRLQAEFKNVIHSVSKLGNASCSSASIAWNPQRVEVQQSSFILGFSANPPFVIPPRWGRWNGTLASTGSDGVVKFKRRLTFSNFPESEKSYDSRIHQTHKKSWCEEK
ncbi:Nucleoside diphosphate kinase B [Olea europaea subsp. europaea]|uniref:Nucleoside diphosphate kinase B n=1 Tax=Olea europaea subsp. europaea TaxID=158383 RepID=A0A8S0SW16_OLEEU|nr:Nucleoside diphosphate kinase B [Olea europaea subsp. europaea]